MSNYIKALGEQKLTQAREDSHYSSACKRSKMSPSQEQRRAKNRPPKRSRCNLTQHRPNTKAPNCEAARIALWYYLLFIARSLDSGEENLLCHREVLTLESMDNFYYGKIKKRAFYVSCLCFTRWLSRFAQGDLIFDSLNEILKQWPMKANSEFWNLQATQTYAISWALKQRVYPI